MEKLSNLIESTLRKEVSLTKFKYDTKTGLQVIKGSPSTGDPIRFSLESRNKSLVQFEDTEQGQKFRGFILENFETATKELAKIKNLVAGYISNFSDPELQGLGLYLYSPNPGSGKTMMGCIVANELLIRYGVNSQVFTIVHYLNRIKESFRDERKSAMDLTNSVQYAGVLIIDELGGEYTKSKESWSEEQVFDIVDKRYNAKKPTIYTSNKSIDELPYHPRVKSRLFESTIQIPFPDTDYRKQIGKENQQKLIEKLSNQEKL